MENRGNYNSNILYMPSADFHEVTELSEADFKHTQSVSNNHYGPFKSFWNKVYEKPNQAESAWGVFSLFKDGLITLVSWIPVLEPSALALTVLVDSTKNLINNKYKQTLRNIFNSGTSNSFLDQFKNYYIRRISYNITTGFLVSFAAYTTDIFSYEMFFHIITSRFLASSHFIVGIFEDNLIYKRFISRKKVAHIGGVLSTVGAILGNLDLARISIQGLRPGLIGLFLSLSMLIFYYFFQKFKIINRRSLKNYRKEFKAYIISDSNLNR